VDPAQFLGLVIRPTLRWLHLESPEAEALLLGTALAESRLTHLAQLDGGPALGVYQMEPATHDDIWRHYLAFRRPMAARIEALIAPRPRPRTHQLPTNLAYATAMARLHYLRVAAPLPAEAPAMAAYHKRHYNTNAGAAEPAETERWFRRARRLVEGDRQWRST